MDIEEAVLQPAPQARSAVLEPADSQGRVRVGTSGWMYKHWANGVFYPRNLRPIDWLEYYAERFNTVEINATFYRLPSETAVARWARLAPPDFRFAVKCWRWITHVRKLRETGIEDVQTFLIRIEPLAASMGPLLVQLPPSMKADLERLEGFLKQLPRRLGGEPLRVAVEVRNESWLTDALRSLLDRFGAALVLHDSPKGGTYHTNEAPFVYIRRHGGRHDGGNYSKVEIEADAHQIRRFAADSREVYVYYNNDWHGYAIQNATRLIEILESQPRRTAVGE